MALIFVDPDAAGDAGVVNIAGECYSFIGNSTTVTPNALSVQGAGDACECSAWTCTNCIRQCFASNAKVLLTWSFDMPTFPPGTDGYCMAAFEAIQSGSVVMDYTNYSPFEFSANIPFWGNGGDDTDLSIAVAYACGLKMWSFTITKNITYPDPPPDGFACENVTILRGATFDDPDPTNWIPGDSCGADYDGNGASLSGPECFFFGMPWVTCLGAALTGTFSLTVLNNTDCCYDADAVGGPACLTEVGAPCPSPNCADGG